MPKKKIKPKIKPKKITKKVTKVTKTKPLHQSFPKKRTIAYKYIKKSSFLRACQFGALTAQEIEAGRRVIKKQIKKRKSIILNVRAFPYLILTKKPSEVRMGKGRGTKINKKICPTYPGKTIYELINIKPKKTKKIFKAAMKKLSIKTKIFHNLP